MPGEFRYIIRIEDTDLDGFLKVSYALTNIKGIGIRLANIIVKNAGVNPKTRLGFLSDAEVKKIEDVLRKPDKYGMPGWLFNRPKDIQTGTDLHLIGSDLVLQTKMDIDDMKKVKSWRGFRHAYGLKVRGQRTRTTGRKRKAISVKKARRKPERAK